MIATHGSHLRITGEGVLIFLGYPTRTRDFSIAIEFVPAGRVFASHENQKISTPSVIFASFSGCPALGD